jgi:hypothetical protein
MTYEITLLGFDIESATNELIKWVKSDCRLKLDKWLQETFPGQVQEVREMPWAANYGVEDGIDYFLDTDK